MKRIIVKPRAILMATIVPPILATAYFSVLAAFSWAYNGINPRDIYTLFIIFFSALLITVAHLVLLGLPAVWLLIRLNYIGVYTIAMAGFILGFTPTAIWSSDASDLDAILKAAGFCGVLGMASSLAFWWACTQTPNNSSNLTGAQNALSS